MMFRKFIWFLFRVARVIFWIAVFLLAMIAIIAGYVNVSRY